MVPKEGVANHAFNSDTVSGPKHSVRSVMHAAIYILVCLLLIPNASRTFSYTYCVGVKFQRDPPILHRGGFVHMDGHFHFHY